MASAAVVSCKFIPLDPEPVAIDQDVIEREELLRAYYQEALSAGLDCREAADYAAQMMA